MFDLGGVVIDIDFGRVLRAWAARAGCDPALLRERFTVDEAYLQHERGELPASGYFAAVRRSLGLDLSDEEFIAGWNDIYLGPVAGVPEMLTTAARHYPLFAFSNTNPTHQRVWSTQFASELASFRSVFTSSEIGLRKPDLAAFTAVAEQAGFAPRNIVFFDDTAENVTGARAAGLQAVLVRSAHDVRTALLRVGVDVAPSGRGIPGHR